MGRKTMMVASLFIVMFGIGCAHELREENYTPGSATYEQFERDSAVCELESEEKVRGGTAHYNRLFDACMRLKGYARRKEGEGQGPDVVDPYLDR
jgi:hypothetical protein